MLEALNCFDLSPSFQSLPLVRHCIAKSRLFLVERDIQLATSTTCGESFFQSEGVDQKSLGPTYRVVFVV